MIVPLSWLGTGEKKMSTPKRFELREPEFFKKTGFLSLKHPILRGTNRSAGSLSLSFTQIFLLSYTHRYISLFLTQVFYISLKGREASQSKKD